MKKIRYFIEFVIASALIFLFRALGARNASSAAGLIGRSVGPKLAASRKARANLQQSLPGADANLVIAGMWDNLARIFAEYPHLQTIAEDIEVTGFENIRAAYEKYGQVIVFSGHIGNWEIMAPALLSRGIHVDLVYRAPNNPWTDRILDRYRSLNGKLKTLPKSRSGTRALVESIKSGRSVGILIDQKYNEGIEADFFGRPAMTSTAFAQLGQKFDVPLIPFRVERLDGIKMRLSFYPPLAVKNDAGDNLPLKDIVHSAHTLLEKWITERPDQWLWLHRRWKM